MSRSKGRGPLAGLKVIDLTSVLMGPYTTQIFADLGADVIKVESPEGDTTRYLPPGPTPDCGGMFMNLNRGKRSLVLDLKQLAARQVLLRLCRQADIFIHSMRAQAIRRLGLAYAAMAEANPRLVYANLYGFGRRGRYANYPAYDDIIQAVSGLADLQARLSGGTPTYLATVVADKVAGLTAAYAVLAALYARERTGVGQEIEVPMFETMVSFAMTEHLGGSLFEPPIGPPEYPRIVATERQPYRTRDGYIAVMIYTDKHWRAFFDVIGNPEWSKDPMFANIRCRTENIRAVLGRVSALIERRTTDEWMEVFRAAQLPAMPLRSLTDLLHDDHLEEAGFWVRRETEHGMVRFPGIPTDFSVTPGEIGNPGPRLGAHSLEVLEEAGFHAEEIASLRKAGAVGG
ncbi:CaiB/BaiF CoA transferase family protein [Rhizorhapis sp. SPR117]|uniref:CaiB/BaiF CoA transferase family protein n=1 Tax=Rhizorhapis sp. SPR117 TaxID=2912611 RepID=UPI001F25BEF0|nr:CoA transferase [Rhizorhapis sp. SPR117]